MFTQKTLAAAAAIALLPAGAFAGEFSATAGFEASVDLDNDFVTTGDGVELYVGAGFSEGGFSADLTFTFDSTAMGTDDFNTELSLGYGGDITDATGYSVALTSDWNNDSGYNTTEAEFELSHAFTDTIDGSYTYTYDLETEADAHEIAADIAVGDWTVSPSIADDGATTSYELAFAYDFESGVSAEIAFADDDSAGSQMTSSITLGYEIDLM